MKLICLAGEGPVHDAMSCDVIAVPVLADAEQHVIVSLGPAMRGIEDTLGAACKLEAAAECILQTACWRGLRSSTGGGASRPPRWPFAADWAFRPDGDNRPEIFGRHQSRCTATLAMQSSLKAAHMMR